MCARTSATCNTSRGEKKKKKLKSRRSRITYSRGHGGTFQLDYFRVSDSMRRGSYRNYTYKRILFFCFFAPSENQKADIFKYISDFVINVPRSRRPLLLHTYIVRYTVADSKGSAFRTTRRVFDFDSLAFLRAIDSTCAS